MQPVRPHISPLDQLAALATSKQPTTYLKAIRLRAAARETEPLLPLDHSGNVQLSHNDLWDGQEELLWDDTICCVESLIERYHALSGRYPTEICLCTARYEARKINRFYPRMPAKPIPFVWEPGNIGQYEILVRGKAK